MDLIHKSLIPASRAVAVASGRFAPELVHSGSPASESAEEATELEPLDLVVAHLNRLELYRVDARGTLTLVAQTEVAARIGSISRFPSPVWISGQKQPVRKDWLLVAIDSGFSGGAVARSAGQVSMIAMIVEFKPLLATWYAQAVYSFAQECVYVLQDDGIRDAALTIDKALEHVVLRAGAVLGDGMWRRGGGYGEERPLTCVDAVEAAVDFLNESSRESNFQWNDGRCGALVVPAWRKAYILAPPLCSGTGAALAHCGIRDDVVNEGALDADPTAGRDAHTRTSYGPGAMLWTEDVQETPVSERILPGIPAAETRGRKLLITERDQGIQDAHRVYYYAVELEALLGHVRILDCCFLTGTALPTMVVLYEERPTWAGRVEAVSNSCALAAIVLPPLPAGAAGEEPLVAWRVQGLPFDAEKVVPLPSVEWDRAAEQGLLLIAANVLFWIRGNGQIGASLSGNHFGDTFMELDGCQLPGALYGGTDSDIISRCRTSQVLHFQGACIAPVRLHRYGLFLADGNVYQLALHADAEYPLRLEALRVRGESRLAPAPLDAKLLSRDLLFVAAHLGSSVLYRMTQVHPHGRRTRTSAAENGTLHKNATTKEAQWELQQRDTIFQLGPIVDLVVIPPRYSPPAGTLLDPGEILAATGHQHQSCLARCTYQVQTREWQRIPSAGCRRVWSLYADHDGTGMHQEEQAFLLLSLSKSSVILDIRRGFEQAADTRVLLPSPTIAAGNLAQRRLIAQVHRTGIRLLDANLDVVYEEDMLLAALEPGTAVSGASVVDPYIAVWFTNHRLQVWRLEHFSEAEAERTTYRLSLVFSREHVLCASLYDGVLCRDFQAACRPPRRTGNLRTSGRPMRLRRRGASAAPGSAATAAATQSSRETHRAVPPSALSRGQRALAGADLPPELGAEETFLYGALALSDAVSDATPEGASNGTPETTARGSQPEEPVVPALHSMLAVVSVDGALYLYALGSEKNLLLLRCKRFFLGVHQVLDDRSRQAASFTDAASAEADAEAESSAATTTITTTPPTSPRGGTTGVLHRMPGEATLEVSALESGTRTTTPSQGAGLTSLSSSSSSSMPRKRTATTGEDAPKGLGSMPANGRELGPRRTRQGKVLDVCLVDIGERTCPVLAAVLASGEVVLYRGYVVNRGILCFARVGSDALSTVLTPSVGVSANAPPMSLSTSIGTTAPERDSKASSRRSVSIRLMPFRRIQGKSGISIIGQRVILVLGDTGYPTIHPVRGPGLLALADLHHEGVCSQGFVSVATDGTVRIGQWPVLARAQAVGNFLVQKHAWPQPEYVERLLHDPSTDTILAIVGRMVPATEAAVKYLLEGNRYESMLRHARRKQQQQQEQQEQQQEPGLQEAEESAVRVTHSSGMQPPQPLLLNADARRVPASRGDTAGIRARGDSSTAEPMDMDDVANGASAMTTPGGVNGTAETPWPSTTARSVDESVAGDVADDPPKALAAFEEQKLRPFDSGRERDLPLLIDQHAVVLLARNSLEVLARYDLEQTEVGLAMCATRIRHFQRTGDDEAPRFTERDVLVVGTCFLRGEDTSIRGRLLVFEISRQEGRQHHQHHQHQRTLYQMQTLAATEVKGAVSAVAPVKGGFVCCSAGPRLEVYKLIEDEMSCISFYPGINLFFSHVGTLKQYILASDMRYGVSFLFWRSRNVSQNFLCRDEAQRELVASEWLMHGTKANVLSADMLGNIIELSIPSPVDPESAGGTRMTFEAGFHVGSRPNAVRRVRIDDPSAETPPPNEPSSLWNTHVILLGTVDGMITMVSPLLRGVAKKLELAAQDLMLEPELRKWCLYARSWRVMRSLTVAAGLRKPKRSILDGDVLQLYGSLDTPRRKEIARRIGMPQEALFEAIFGTIDEVLQVF